MLERAELGFELCCVVSKVHALPPCREKSVVGVEQRSGSWPEGQGPEQQGLPVAACTQGRLVLSGPRAAGGGETPCPNLTHL